MKILIFIDISLVGVYSYIKKYQWKFCNIYIYEMEIDKKKKNSWNVRNNSKNDRKIIMNILKLF